MTAFIELLLLLTVFGALAFWRVPLQAATIIVGASLLVATFFSSLSFWLLTPLWLIYIGSAALFNHPLWRHTYFSKPLLNYVRKTLPQMGETKKIALEAGDVWWEGELFQGNPDWQKLRDLPKAELTQAEQAFIENEVEMLCSLIDDWALTKAGDLPENVWEFIKIKGFWALMIPVEYGGKGFSTLAHSAIITKIATRSISVAVSVMVPNSLGPAELLTFYGTDAQKKQYLPRLATGEDIPCFALTGTNSGSDAAGMQDRGVVCYDSFEGKKTLGIKLSWDKRYITLAPIATVLGLAFKLYDPEHLLGEKENLGITLALLPSNHPGVEMGERHEPMGMAFMNGPTRGQDVFIPMDWIVGGQDYIGQGWRMLMECLSIGRSISLPALSTATAQLCYRTTGAYGRLREQFSTPIASFTGVQKVMARIAGLTYTLEAARELTAQAGTLDIKPSLVSAIAKYHMTEMARVVINDAMDVHAGRGIQMGPRNYLALHYQGIPISITVEGANILTRNLIIFGQGAMRCHPFIREEMAAAAMSDDDAALESFDNVLMRHVGYTVSNLCRSFAYGVTGGHFIQVPTHKSIAKYTRQLTRLSTALASVGDMALLLLGGDLKRQETLSARLGDVLSHLYIGSAVLNYYDKQGQPAEDLPFVEWALATQLANAQDALLAFFNNFPNRIVGRLLQFTVFPFGRSYRQPSDRLERRLAKAMQVPGEFRDRLTQLCYRGKDDSDLVARMDHALAKVIACEPASTKLKRAIKHGQIPANIPQADQWEKARELKVLNAIEVKALQEAQRAIDDAIKVDDFPGQRTVKKRQTQKQKSAS